MNRRQQNGKHERHRLHFDQSEAGLPWLAPLLDAYAWVDAGIEQDLAIAPRPPACGPGCCVCCINQRIPLTSPEFSGIVWYATTQLEPTKRRALAHRLRTRPPGCPFLIDSVCAVYPLRPIVCRRYIVFGEPCAPDEDAFVTRPHDVLRPTPAYKQRADRLLLGCLGVVEKQAQDKALQQRLLQDRSHLLFDCDFSLLADKLEAEA